MEILRCLIADIPQKVLADIVQRVTQQDGKIHVVGQVPDIGDISGILNTQKIDVLIMGMRNDTPHDFCREILDQFPQLLIVGLVNDGRMAVVCLADLGSSQLVNLITNLGNSRLLKNVSGDELI